MAVLADARGVTRIGTGAIAGSLLRIPPTIAITSPSVTVTSTPIVVTWTYISAASHLQYSYRVKILTADGSTTLVDTGTVVSTALTVNSTFSPTNGSSYLVQLTVSDLFDSTLATTTFLYDGSVAFAAEARLGSVYEVGINGVGYMLADHPEKELKYERRVIPLDSQRLSTSGTPFSQSIDRYTIASNIDWTDGANQKYFDRENSSPSAYWNSNGIDPFSLPGGLQLVPTFTTQHSTSYATPRVVVAGTKLYVLTGTGTFNEYDDPTDVTATAFTIAAAAAYKSVCSDGEYWYYADGANVFRNNVAVDPGAAWSASDAHVVQWCSDRIFIARPSSGSTPNALYEMSAAGAEVGGLRVSTLPVGSTIRSISSGDGWVYFTGSKFDKSAIYSVQLGSDNSYGVALEIPAGLEARNIGYYQGNLFVRCRDTAGKAVIYRCAAQSGKLTATKVLDIVDATGVDMGDGDFAGDDRFVYFSWRRIGYELGGTSYSTSIGSGLGVIDLSTGGWSKWTAWRDPSTGSGAVGSIALWYGRPIFTIDAIGALYLKANTAADNGNMDLGVLETSRLDLGSGLRKVWTELKATFDALPANGKVTVSYSTDAVTFTDLAQVTNAGSKTAGWTLNVEADQISFRIKLEGTTFSPVFRTLSVRANPVGLADQVLVLPINCADTVAGLNGQVLGESGPGAGAARARTLEGLVQTRVVVQDIDWKFTNVTYTYDLVGVETHSVGKYARNQGRQAQAQITVLTLRRSYK